MIQISSVIVEPSIGQVEYVKSVLNMTGIRNVSYMAFEIELADVNIDVLKRTLVFLIKRHESLRTTFPLINGEVKQVIAPYYIEDFKLDYYEVIGDEQFVTLKKNIYRNADIVISNLTRGPLVKAILIRKYPVNYFFAFLVNHIICDAWSGKIIERELFETYTAYASGKEPLLPQLIFQLRDYCKNQNSHLLKSRTYLSNFWDKKLKGYRNMIVVDNFYRTYEKRNSAPLHTGCLKQYDSIPELVNILNQEVTAAYSVAIITGFQDIKELARKKHCTVSAIVYTSFYILLSFYAQKNKVLFASLVADRVKPENQPLIGCLLGGTYIAANMSPATTIDNMIEQVFCDLLESVENVIFSHDFLKIEGSGLRTSCDMYVNYISTEKLLQVDEHQYYLDKHVPDEGIYYTLNCMSCEYDNALIIKWRYNKYLFTTELIEDMVRVHGIIIDNIIANNRCTFSEIITFLNVGSLKTA